MVRPLFLHSTQGLKHLANFRRQIRRFAKAWNFSEVQVDEIELAVDEAITNAVVHAYEPGEVPRLELRASGNADRIVFKVRDFGKAFVPQPVTARQVRRQVADHRRHGLGRFLMQHCMSAVDYRSVPGRYNETQMIKFRLPDEGSRS
jgi:anti-sigma regulatory factor (Ser/Thr protein kinase)